MQNEVFHFLCCVQAPLGTGEVFRLLAMTLNLVEGGQRGVRRVRRGWKPQELQLQLNVHSGDFKKTCNQVVRLCSNCRRI